MPTRLLSDRICKSDTIASLSPGAEILFYRLLVSADDYGRFDGRPSVIRGHCFPLQMEKANERRIGQWLDELEAAELLRRYSAEGQDCLEIVTWGRYQRTRASTSKYPPPPGALYMEGAEVSDNSQAVVSEFPQAADSGGQMRPYSLSGDVDDIRSSIDDRTSARNGTRSPPATAPPELAKFDEILRGFKEYRPTTDFYEQVMAEFPHVRFSAEAVKIADWCRAKSKPCSVARILNWLPKAEKEATQDRNGQQPHESDDERNQRLWNEEQQRKNPTSWAAIHAMSQ